MALIAVPGFAQNGQWSLQRCIDYAIEHSITVKQQEKNVENSEISLSTARNSRLPNLNASASQSFNFGRGLTSDNTYTNRNTRSTGFDLGTSIPIYTGGQIPNNIAARRFDLQAAVADLDRARENIAVQVASGFLEALYQKELVSVAERQVELSLAQLRRIERLYQNGKQAESDVAQARSVVANDQLSLTQQRNAMQLALLDLSQLLELSTPEGFDIQQPDSLEVAQAIACVLASPDDIFSVATVSRPQIKAEQFRLESAKRNISIARSGLLPSLNFSGGMGSSYYKTSGFPAERFGSQIENNLNHYIGLSLSIPIFNRFSVRNQIRQAKVQAENQQLALDATQKSLYKEIQQAYYNAVAARKQYEASGIAEEAAHASFDLMQKKFENGKANSTEYEEARTRHLKAQADLLQAKYTYLFRQKILNFYRGDTLY